MPDGIIKIQGTLTGFNGIAADFERRMHEYVAIDVQDLKNGLDDLMEEIKANYVPIDIGDLRDSGYVRGPYHNGTNWIIEIGFGEEYALIQHERLDYFHPHGQAKYLEEPLTQFLNRYRQRSRRIRSRR